MNQIYSNLNQTFRIGSCGRSNLSQTRENNTQVCSGNSSGPRRGEGEGEGGKLERRGGRREK